MAIEEAIYNSCVKKAIPAKSSCLELSRLERIDTTNHYGFRCFDILKVIPKVRATEALNSFLSKNKIGKR